jgi:hypothetical protein
VSEQTQCLSTGFKAWPSCRHLPHLAAGIGTSAASHPALLYCVHQWHTSAVHCASYKVVLSTREREREGSLTHLVGICCKVSPTITAPEGTTYSTQTCSYVHLCYIIWTDIMPSCDAPHKRTIDKTVHSNVVMHHTRCTDAVKCRVASAVAAVYTQLLLRNALALQESAHMCRAPTELCKCRHCSSISTNCASAW